MLPGAQNSPTKRGESLIRIPIAPDVPVKLRFPVARVRPRICPMERASVPKAAIDVNHEALPLEDKIGLRPAPSAELDGLPLAEAKATVVEN